MKQTLLAGLTLISAISYSAVAHDDNDGNNYNFTSEQCSIKLNYGLVIKDEQIRFIDNDQTIVQINEQTDLFINGKLIALDNQQQALLKDYAQGIHRQTPVVVNLAHDAVAIASSALGHVLAAFSDSEDAEQKINSLSSRLEQKIGQRFSNDQGDYYIAQQNLDDLDSVIENELESEIDELTASIVGNLLIAAGKAMNEEEGSFAEKMDAFGARMEAMGEEIERTVETEALALEQHAEELCQGLKQLDDTELRLQQHIDDFKDINLIDVES
ncbi:DUF2884 family protein [Thalassotalea ponticola]|uniref:DUF2884 family protein n=1 Tax=Thalassotalea ponticola TaxID=1523392 RepID=UPI0025B50B6B|nr:DUF2884 family protein [Thalassotalea ponticola]MDN3652030.1 DUF2884 family protein [Thalassotalea ponticola]